MENAISLEQATAEAFAPFVGTEFTITEGPGEGVILELVSASRRRSDQPAARPFSLIFAGPPDIALEQQIYTLAHPVAGSLPIFLVPIAGDSRSRSYEAVFN